MPMQPKPTTTPTTPATQSRSTSAKVMLIVGLVGLIITLAVIFLYQGPKPVWLMLTEGGVAAVFAALALTGFKPNLLGDNK